jgi:hypothetical protein
MPPSQGCCSHDHDCEAADCGPAYSLYTHIALDQVGGAAGRCWEGRRAPLRGARACRHSGSAARPPHGPPRRPRPPPPPLQVRCLNEGVPGCCRNVFRAWDARAAAVPQPLVSDPDDEELLLVVPCVPRGWER